MKKRIGVDIGGTKIAAGLIADIGQVQFEAVKASPADNREQMFLAVCDVINEVLGRNNLLETEVALGIGVPGIVDAKTGTAIFQNNLPWDNFPLLEALEKAFPEITDITIDNDVIQAGFAEWQALDLGNEEVMVFLTVSTGIASPVFYGGRAIQGLGISGELGLIPVWDSQETQFSTLEEAISGPALARKAQKSYGDPNLSTADLFDRYQKGDEIAQAIVSDFVQTLSQAIYMVISLLNPQHIVLGGSVIKKNEWLLPLIKVAVGSQMIDVQKNSLESIVLSRYDNNAGLVGAGLSAKI